MADDWDVAKKQAMKILGDKGKIPEIKAQSAYDGTKKTWAAFSKARDDIEAKLADLEAAFEKASGVVDQFEAKLEKDDLGLDPKNKDDAKKIDQARDILTNSVKGVEKFYEDDIKAFKELARHIIQLGSYKPRSDVA